MDADRFEHVEVRCSPALWAWLAEHHGQSESVWLVTWKAAHQERYVSRDEVLDALIAYGWIDGRRMKLDDTRTMQLISLRKQQLWTNSYRSRAKRLMDEDLMQDAGAKAVARAKASGTWEALTDVDALHVTADLDDALGAAKAKPWWDASAPSYRRNVLRWVAGAKRADTRAKRIATITSHAARGEKVPQY